MKVGVVRERAPNERRVALVPELIGKYQAAGLEVLVEAGAGAGALIPDSAYAAAGATVVSTEAPVRPGRRRPARPEARRRRGRPACGRARPSSACSSRSSIRSTAKTLADARRHRHQPRRAAAHAVARQTMDALSVAGQRRRLQGGPHRGRGLRPLLPAADHRRRHGQARQRAHPGHRRGRAPGHRHRAPPGRHRQGLRRALGDEGAGRVARRRVPRAQVGRRRHRRGRLRARADAPRSGRPSRRSSTATSRPWTWSSPRPRCPAAGRRCWSPPTRSSA